VSHTKGRKNQYMTELNSIRGREYTLLNHQLG